MNRRFVFRVMSKARLRLKRAFLIATAAVTMAALGLLLAACNLDRVGDVFMNQCQYASAIPCYEVMTLVESGCGTKSERLANAWTNLGICYAKLARENDALKVQNLAVEMRKEILESQT